MPPGGGGSRALLVVFMLPWVMSAIPAFISIHWMLVSEQGFINSFLRDVNRYRGTALAQSTRGLPSGRTLSPISGNGCPFWTLVLLAARMAIPPDIYEAAQVDGAGGLRRFADITLPLIANVFFIATLLSVIWTVGDFTIVFLVSGGGPFHLTEVVATLANRYWFDYGQPDLGVAAVISMLPLLIPIAVVLMRRVQARGVAAVNATPTLRRRLRLRQVAVEGGSVALAAVLIDLVAAADLQYGADRARPRRRQCRVQRRSAALDALSQQLSPRRFRRRRGVRGILAGVRKTPFIWASRQWR